MDYSYTRVNNNPLNEFSCTHHLCCLFVVTDNFLFPFQKRHSSIIFHQASRLLPQAQASRTAFYLACSSLAFFFIYQLSILCNPSERMRNYETLERVILLSKTLFSRHSTDQLLLKYLIFTHFHQKITNSPVTARTSASIFVEHDTGFHLR